MHSTQNTLLSAGERPSDATPAPRLVTLRAEADVATIRLDDGRANVLGTRMLLDLEAAFDAADGAGAALLTGRPRIFSAGLDLAEIGALSRSGILEFLDVLHRVRRKIFAWSRPLVAAVSGSAVGAGASIACCADVRLGTRGEGQFALPEVLLGVPVPSSALEIVRSTLAPSDAARVMLFGASFGPDEALSMGMFHQLVEADRLAGAAQDAALAASKLSDAAVTIKRSLRHDAMQRMDAARVQSHEAFADAWVTPWTRARIETVLLTLGTKNTRVAAP